MSTPYTTPNRIPDHPVGDELGLSVFATSLALPTLTITLMKKASTTATDTSDRVSWTRVEICTPKYSTTKMRSANSRLQPHTGNGDDELKMPGIFGSDVKNVS